MINVKSLEGLKKISASRFTWELSACRQGYSGMELFDHNKNVPRLDHYGIKSAPVGWCHAKDLEVRPRDEGYAVLFEIYTDDAVVWIHVEEDFEY